MPSNLDLRDRKLLVTGATGGIGAELCLALCGAGAHVALAGRDPERLADLVARCAEVAGCAGRAGAAVAVPADAVSADPDALVDRAVAALGGLDGVVHGAGVVEYQATPAVTIDALARQLQVNFVFPLMLSQAVARHLAGHGGGDIIAVTSTLAERPAPMTAAYAASKAALTAALRTMAIELGPQQVRVNAVAPGVVDTQMVRVPRLAPGEAALTPEAASERVETQLQELTRLHLLGRLGRPQDVVDAVTYLLSSPWVTGTILTVDGGLSLS